MRNSVSKKPIWGRVCLLERSLLESDPNKDYQKLILENLNLIFIRIFLQNILRLATYGCNQNKAHCCQ